MREKLLGSFFSLVLSHHSLHLPHVSKAVFLHFISLSVSTHPPILYPSPSSIHSFSSSLTQTDISLLSLSASLPQSGLFSLIVCRFTLSMISSHSLAHTFTQPYSGTMNACHLTRISSPCRQRRRLKYLQSFERKVSQDSLHKPHQQDATNDLFNISSTHEIFCISVLLSKRP